MITQDAFSYAHTPFSVPAVLSSGTYRPLNSNDFNGAFYDFSGCLGTASGQEVVLDNFGNFSTIGFHIPATSGLSVGFYGSFDDINYETITFRQIGGDGYTQIDLYDGSANSHIGSISALRKIKFVNLYGSSQSGCVMGRMTTNVSTLEGIEHGNPPHKYGNTPFHKGIYLNNTTGSGISIVTPPTGFKFIITDIGLSISSAGAYVTLYEDDNAADPDKWVFSAYVKANLADTQVYNLNLSTPFVSSQVNWPLKLHVSDTTTVRGVVHGYYSRD